MDKYFTFHLIKRYSWLTLKKKSNFRLINLFSVYNFLPLMYTCWIFVQKENLYHLNLKAFHNKFSDKFEEKKKEE